jgi:hypothetical protein
MPWWLGLRRKSQALLAWSIQGAGRFLIAAARKFPNAQLIAVELDPLASLMLRANAAVHGFADRLAVHLVDYRSFALPAIACPTLFIGNPPYVRHPGREELARCHSKPPWLDGEQARRPAHPFLPQDARARPTRRLWCLSSPRQNGSM